MSGRLWHVAIFMGLVAIPVANLHAQSNPWYIPPQLPTQAQPGVPGQQVTPQLVPQVYTQAPQYGFGAGYAVPQQMPTTIVVPQTSAVPQNSIPGYGYAPQPTTTGAVGSVPPISGAPAYATSMPSSVITYQAAPGTAMPQYAPQMQAVPQQPATVYVVPPQPQPQAYTYQQPQQVFGSYPPLGSDPTVPVQPPPLQHAQSQQTAPAAPATSAWGGVGTPQYPGFSGPSTLSPSMGAFPGLSPIYPAPYGATPYLGLPFY